MAETHCMTEKKYHSRAVWAAVFIQLHFMVFAPQAAANDFISQIFSGAFWTSPNDHSVVEERRSRGSHTNTNYCVRLCDGFYWPVNIRGSMTDKAAACEASCQSPARLYQMSSSGQSTETMRNTDGRPYSELPAAFKYRATYDPACSCRPAPWSTAEQQRHKEYAFDALERGTVKAVAGAPRSHSSGIITGAVVQTVQATRAQQPPRRNTPTSARSTGDDSWKKNVLGN